MNLNMNKGFETMIPKPKENKKSIFFNEIKFKFMRKEFLIKFQVNSIGD